jgi:hypothetical protein
VSEPRGLAPRLQRRTAPRRPQRPHPNRVPPTPLSWLIGGRVVPGWCQGSLRLRRPAHRRLLRGATVRGWLRPRVRGPRPARKRFGPRHQQRRLDSTRPHRDLSKFVLAFVNRYCLVCRLCGSTPIISFMSPPWVPVLMGNRGGHSYLQSFVLIPLSSHTTARSPPGNISLESQTQQGRQALRERLRQRPRRRYETVASTASLKQEHW